MRRIMKWTGIVVVATIVLVAAAGATVYLVTNARMNTAYTFMPDAVAVETDSVSIARGEHLAAIRGCTDCHGDDLGGGAVIEEPPVAMLYATNLTTGRGGRASQYRERDWVRAIRHGIGVDGKPLIFMPSQEYQVLSNEDVGDLIAFITSRSAVDREMPETKVGPIGRVLYLSGQLELLPAELVDHENVRPPDRMEEAPTPEYGAYLATGCIGCHGHGFSGGPIPGVPPDYPAGANLTPDSETGLGNWTEADFARALREGVRPDGSAIDPFMPVKLTSELTNTEIRAIWLYLRSLDPKPYGGR